MAETVQASTDASVPVPKRRRPRIRWSLPDWIPRALVTIAVIAAFGWVFWKIPPIQLFHLFDQRVIRLVRWTHQFRTTPAAPQPTLLEINLPQVPEPLYALQFSSSAQKQLDDLPFETFERVRDRAIDLAFDPQPSAARINAERPGSWSILQDGFRILYLVRDQPKSVTIETIQKAH
jgi:mRNA-degrading endonuclease RelE of RelBE toxin-antitoxin system